MRKDSLAKGRLHESQQAELLRNMQRVMGYMLARTAGGAVAFAGGLMFFTHYTNQHKRQPHERDPEIDLPRGGGHVT